MNAGEVHAEKVLGQLKKLDATSDPSVASLVLDEAKRLEKDGLGVVWSAKLHLAAAMARARIEGRRPLRR